MFRLQLLRQVPLESYVSNTANAFSDTLAMGSFVEGFKALEKAYVDNDTDSREKMLVSSTLGGIAFSNCGLGIVHSIAHSIGAEFNIPHGLANALILPYGIEFNSQDATAKEKYAELAYYVRVSDLKTAIIELNEKVSIPSTLSDLVEEEVYTEALDRLVNKALNDVTLGTNPIKPSEEEMRTLINQIYYG